MLSFSFKRAKGKLVAVKFVETAGFIATAAEMAAAWPSGTDVTERRTVHSHRCENVALAYKS